MESALPASLTTDATLQGSEFGWAIPFFPEALKNARALGFACLGGQFQFRVPEGTCEMYWLDADSEEMRDRETWSEYVQRSCAEVLAGFDLLVRQTDFREQALSWPLLRSSVDEALVGLVFVAYFVTEEEYTSVKQKTGL